MDPSSKPLWRLFAWDFLDVMKKVFLWSRGFGVAGPGVNLWLVWGTFIMFLMFAIQCGAIYKFVKLLMGLTVFSSGNRSVTARLAGTIFYSTCSISLLLSWRLSRLWNKLSTEWVAVEKRLTIPVPEDKTLRRRMIVMMLFMTVCAFVEHTMSIVSSVEIFDKPLSMLLEVYVLESHGFIFIQSDVSIWTNMLVFFISNVATILWSFQDLVIILISMGLTSRYCRLNRCVAKVTASDRRETNWCKNTQTLRVYTWRKLREAYVKQAMLVRKIDRSLGGLILLSSGGNFYFICLQLFQGHLSFAHGVSETMLKRLYIMVSLLWVIARFTCVVLYAADINLHSRRALRHLHACSARYYNVEVKIDRLQTQLSKEYVSLSGMGFFHLDRSILLKMVGAIITYELVLIQFDDK